MTADEWLTQASGGAHCVGTLQGRMAVAMRLGYADSRTLVHLRETFGLALCDSVVICQKRGLKIDWSSLRYELEKMGKKTSSIDSELKEARHFADFALAEQKAMA